MLQYRIEIPALDTKVSVFAQNHINKYPHYPKGFTWHIIERKHIKHDYYSRLIMWTHKNSRYKYWVVSQQALFFNAFLLGMMISMMLT